MWKKTVSVRDYRGPKRSWNPDEIAKALDRAHYKVKALNSSLKRHVNYVLRRANPLTDIEEPEPATLFLPEEERREEPCSDATISLTGASITTPSVEPRYPSRTHKSVSCYEP